MKHLVRAGARAASLLGLVFLIAPAARAQDAPCPCNHSLTPVSQDFARCYKQHPKPGGVCKVVVYDRIHYLDQDNGGSECALDDAKVFRLAPGTFSSCENVNTCDGVLMCFFDPGDDGGGDFPLP